MNLSEINALRTRLKTEPEAREIAREVHFELGGTPAMWHREERASRGEPSRMPYVARGDVMNTAAVPGRDEWRNYSYEWSTYELAFPVLPT